MFGKYILMYMVIHNITVVCCCFHLEKNRVFLLLITMVSCTELQNTVRKKLCTLSWWTQVLSSCSPTGHVQDVQLATLNGSLQLHPCSALFFACFSVSHFLRKSFHNFYKSVKGRSMSSPTMFLALAPGFFLQAELKAP